MSLKQKILKNIRKEILINKTQSIIKIKFNNFVTNVQKFKTIELFSQLKNIVSNKFTKQTKLVLNKIKFNN